MGSAAEGDKNAKGVCVQGSKDTRKEGIVGIDYVKSKRANNKMHKKNKHKKRFDIKLKAIQNFWF